MKNNVYIIEVTRFKLEIYNSLEAYEKFCYDQEDLNCSIPEELLKEYNEIERMYKYMQEKIYKIYTKK